MDLQEELAEKLTQNGEGGNGNASLSEDEKALASLLLLRQTLMAEQSRQFMELLFSENTTYPIRVKNVQVTNGEHFRDLFLALLLLPLLSRDLYTLADFVGAIDSSYQTLQKHQVLQNCLVLLHPLPRRPWAKSRTLEVVPVFNLLPQKRFFAKTGTNVGNGEGDGYIQFQLRNMFGGAENLVFDAVTGTKTPSSYLLDYSQPVLNSARYLWNTLVYVNTRKLDALQSSVDTKGITTKIQTRYDSPLNYSLSLENCWRSMSNHGSRSLQVMAQLANTYKSSLLLNVQYDTRDNHVLPLTGHFARLGLEQSGLFAWNSVAYSKLLWESQLALRLNEHHSALFSTRAGALFNTLGGGSNVLDRFNCGGPNDVRSFSLHGLGPKDNNSSLGGDYFVSGGLSLISKIPRIAADSNFKLHQFVNVGKLFGTTEELRKSLFKDYSVGIGSGILYNHPMARFELNFVLPICASSTDSVRKGLQYGVGVSFL